LWTLSKQTALFAPGLERLFLIEDGKVPATVGRDKRTRDPSTRTSE